jgi:hypothetical protein
MFLLLSKEEFKLGLAKKFMPSHIPFVYDLTALRYMGMTSNRIS